MDLNLLAQPLDLPNWPWPLLPARFNATQHGDFPRWHTAVQQLPELADMTSAYTDTVTARGSVDLDRLENCLRQLHPWRKGPFSIGGLHIDTEWRSDWKWARINPHLDLQGHRVLEIGCGNGYFGWRMLAAGAAEVVGIDPTLLFCMQHQAIQFYLHDPRNWVLPLKIEEIPATAQFDTVFSMGVIYHRRHPQQHVAQLFELTRPGGQVVLESLVVPEQNLQPPGRYARMRNVWCVPNSAQLLAWLQDAGFKHCRLLDESITTTAEQRSTSWMHFESLQEALHPDDTSLTVEGHPAPRRAVVMGKRA